MPLAPPAHEESGSVATYLPALVLGPDAAAMSRGFTPIDGTVVLADITGFTPLSERLATRGKEGAEYLTRIINHYFERLLNLAAAHGGDNLKFGGDALLLLFHGPGHAERAVAAGIGMQQENRRAGTIRVGDERTRLQMRISIHSGTFWSAITGREGVRLQHIVAGPDVIHLAKVDKQASPGDVAMSESTFALVGNSVTTERRGDVILAVSTDRRAPTIEPLRSDDGDVDALLRRWGFTTGIEGEHRKVTVMFVRLDGLNEMIAEGQRAEAFAELGKFVTSLVDAAATYHGYLANNDVDQSGMKFIVLFGAAVANEAPAESALRFALHVKEAAKRLESCLRLRIGVNSGFVFCGEAGAARRREYTVLGDAVNLSARLMTTATDNQVLVAETTAVEAGPAFQWRALESIRVKGKAEPVAVRELEAERKTTVGLGARSQLLGRDRELAQLSTLAFSARQGFGQVVAVTGEPGSGKSRLVAEALVPLLQRGWFVVRGESQSFTSGTPFAGWNGVLTGLLGLTEEVPESARTETAAAAIAALDPALLESAALLNPLLGLSLPESDAIRSLDGENRRRLLLELFGQLIVASSKARPTLVLIEDLHWADASTREVVATIATQFASSRVLLWVTGREPVILPGSPIVIRLTELPTVASRTMLSSLIGRDLPDDVADAIIEKCRGNPLFLEEVARALSSSNQDVSGAAVAVPDRLQSLLTSRLDQLSRPARGLARIASLVGLTFDPEIVRALMPPAVRTSFDGAVAELVDREIVIPDPESSSRLRFRHSLQQEVAYESLLFTRRRELHGDVIRVIVDRTPNLEPVYESLAYHAVQSGRARETVRYSLLAGDKSRGVFAWESAVSYYEAAIEALSRMSGGTSATRSVILERIADALELAGRSGDAADAFVRSLDAWTRALRHPAPVLAEVPADDDVAGRGTRLRLKTAVSLERHHQYDRSLRWLRSASADMPARRPDLRADLCASWSVVAFRKGQFRDALAWANKALTAARRAAQPARIAYAHHVLANSYQETGKLQSSVHHREQALVIYEQLGDLPRQMAGHGNLGLGYQSLGDFPNAIRHDEECIKAATRLRNTQAVAIGNLNLGEVLLAQGLLQEASERFEATVAAYRERGEARVPAGLALINLSRARLRQGEMAAASDFLREGMELLGTASRALAAEGILQEAEIAFAHRDLDHAASATRKALSEARALEMPLVEVKANLLTARLAAETGDRRAALAAGRHALALARRLGAAYETAEAALTLAALSAPDGVDPNPERRRKMATEAGELFERIGALDDVLRAKALS